MEAAPAGRRPLSRPGRPLPRHPRAGQARRGASAQSRSAGRARHGLDAGQDKRDGRARGGAARRAASTGSWWAPPAATPTRPPGPLVAPYAVETILDELSMPTPVVRDGEVQYPRPDDATPAWSSSATRSARPRRSTRSTPSRRPSPTASAPATCQLPALAEPGLPGEGAAAHRDLAWPAPTRSTCAATPVVPRAAAADAAGTAAAGRRRRCAPSASTASRPTAPAGTAVVECVTRAVAGARLRRRRAVDRLPAGGRRRHDLPRRARRTAACSRASARCRYGPLFERLKRYGVEVREQAP